MAETMAHEVGHYLGLFHPVEFDLNTGLFVEGDVHGDTGTCTTFAQCSANGTDQLLMFPTALPSVTQQTISGEQSASMHRWVGID